MQQTKLTNTYELGFQNIQNVQSKGPYNLVGYSFGGSVAFEMVLQLQAKGEKANLILLDGSPAYISQHTSMYKQKNNVDVDQYQSKVGAYVRFMSIFIEIDSNQVSNFSCYTQAFRILRN